MIFSDFSFATSPGLILSQLAITSSVCCPPTLSRADAENLSPQDEEALRRAYRIGSQHERIDRQRVAAVQTLEELGYAFRDGEWKAGRLGSVRSIEAEADAIHSLLVGRADVLIGCTDGSADQDELEAIGEAIEAYEAVRWPDGKANGKG
jgi:hypothetical protein